MMDARPTTDLETHRVAVTFFADQYAKKKVVKQLTLGDILEMVLHVRAPTKKKLPWLKLATFGNKTTGKGSLRHDDNVLAVCGVELDYDLLLISMDEAVAKLRDLGIRSLLYTSPSNTKLQSKFRILAPFAAERPPKDREKFARRLAGAVGYAFDNASFTLSQSFYYGIAEDNGAADHKALIVDGDFIDLRDDLAQFDAAPQPQPELPPPPSQPVKGARGFEAHLSRLGDGPGLEGFNNPLRSATGAYARQHGVGLDRTALKEQLRRAVRAAPKKPERPQDEIDKYLGDEYLDNLIATAVEKYGTIGIIVPDNDHMDRARIFRNKQRPNLLHYRGTFWDYHRGAYSIIDDGVVNANVWSFLDEAAAIRGKDRVQMPFQPDRSSVAETLAALKAVTILDPKTALPVWLNGSGELPLPREHDAVRGPAEAGAARHFPLGAGRAAAASRARSLQ
jgi:hypothetical protein